MERGREEQRGKNTLWSPDYTLPALECCHANSGVCHCPANPHNNHEELADIPSNIQHDITMVTVG